MALLDVVFRLLNKSGNDFVEPRREDGHGSSTSTPSYVQVASEFARIENKQYYNTEEVLYDIPTILTNNFIYVGVAPNGTLQSSGMWTVVRTTFNLNGLPVRKQIRFNVVWNARAEGWT
jgi:hypothetical protein